MPAESSAETAPERLYPNIPDADYEGYTFNVLHYIIPD